MTRQSVSLLHRRAVSCRAGDRREDEKCSRGKYDKVPFLFSKVCERSLSRDLFLIHLPKRYDLNKSGLKLKFR